MYKRKVGLDLKRNLIGSYVNKVHCASTGGRENIANLDDAVRESSDSSAGFSQPCKYNDDESRNIPIQVPLNDDIDFSSLPELFMICGMDVDSESSNILKLDQVNFIRKLYSKLYPSRGKIQDTINKFVTSLKEYFSDNGRFQKALSATITSADCDVARGSTQDSLIRLLLQIEEIQNELANFLLDKLAQLGLQSDVEYGSEINPVDWVRMILQPFRFLNFIMDSKNLCERLFDVVFSSFDTLIKQEVIISLPDIIGDSEHHFAATELSKLLKTELELMPHVVDALTNISVQSEIRKEVRKNLIATLKTSPIEFLPNIVKFLLCTCDSDSYDEILNGMRKELFADDSVSLKNTMTEEKVDVDVLQVLIFSNIRNCLLANKQLSDSWTRNISHINRDSKCRPLDLLVTFILYDVCTESTKKRNIETIFRNRIKNELFGVALIEKTFKCFTPVITEYFSPIMSIMSKLLKSVDICINKFVTSFYLSAFKHTDHEWCQVIIRELQAYVGAGDMNDAQTALDVLSVISETYPGKIRSHASMLRVLLNKLVDLPLKNVQQLTDTLCGIAFADSDNELGVILLKTELTTLIEKQVSSSNIKMLRVGIIGAVMAIKYIAAVADEESNFSIDKCSEDFDVNSLTEKAKRALPFLKLILEKAKIIPEAQAFGFDQFSLMLKKFKNLDKSLMFYTAVEIKDIMRKTFLICSDEMKHVDFMDCALKFGLHDDDEFVILNLTPTLIDELKCNTSAGLRTYTLVLPSLLRLLRELVYDGIEEIEGLLECPVIVPSPAVFEEFSLQTPEVQNIAMDSLFYLTNWFREIVNCFARYKRHETNVLVRLRTLIWLQKMISKYLPQMLNRNYCPPKCHFHKSTKAPIVGSEKKKKIKSTDKKKKNDSKSQDIRKHFTISQSSVQQSVLEDSDEDNKENDEKIVNMKNYKQFFRELDWDVWSVLSTILNLEPESERDWQMKPEFGPSELLFVLEDLVEKIQFVLIPPTKKIPLKSLSTEDMGLTCASLYVDVPQLFVKNLYKLTSRLCAHLETVSGYCKALLLKNDNIIDATRMFMPDTVEIKSAFSLILKTFSILFSWPGFEANNHQDLFVSALSKISSRMEPSVKSSSVAYLIKDNVTYFAQFQETVLHLDCAINLVTLVQALNKHSEISRDICNMSGAMCWNFLSHHWYDWNGVEEKGPTFNKSIEYLLITYFDTQTDKLKAVQKICEKLQDEVGPLNNKNSSLNTIPNINKVNFNILLRVIFKTLATGIKEQVETCTQPDKKLQLWSLAVKIMEYVVNILKIQSVRANHVCFVKGSAPILRLFLNNGITVCSTLFKHESAVVSQILKTLQITTRYLQKVFDNTKVTEDSALCAYLPSIRSLLESILLKVKEIVVMNRCSEAFFVGSMRNKDILGQDILSQSTVNQDSGITEIDEYTTRNEEVEEDSVNIEEEDISEGLLNEGYQSNEIVEVGGVGLYDEDKRRKRRKIDH